VTEQRPLGVDLGCDDHALPALRHGGPGQAETPDHRCDERLRDLSHDVAGSDHAALLPKSPLAAELAEAGGMFRVRDAGTWNRTSR
jgi:hypothetical protein